MKQLFLMLLLLLSGNFLSAQEDVVITFDPEYESKNPDLPGTSLTLSAINLGKYQQLSTGYYFGVQTDEGRKICHVLSFDGLEKAISMDIYNIDPNISAKNCKTKKYKDDYGDEYYEVTIAMTMRMTSMSMFLETVDDAKYSGDKTSFKFASEAEAAAFVAFVLGN